MPHRLRLRVNAVRDAVQAAPENTGTNVPDPEVDATLLMAVAGAIRDHEEIRFAYRDDERYQVEPYRLVSWQRRWYLVARDGRNDTWSNFRLDWMELRIPGGRRFAPVELPGGDYPAFVLRTTAFAGWQVHVRITVYAPAAEVLSRINPAVGVVEALDDDTCVLVTGADSVESLAVYIGMLGLDFRTQPVRRQSGSGRRLARGTQVSGTPRWGHTRGGVRAAQRDSVAACGRGCPVAPPSSMTPCCRRG